MTRLRRVTPESPERLRQCLTALAQHQNCNVLRVEISGAAATTDGHENALVMTVTHSLGPEHEARIAKPLAEAFFGAFRGLADDDDVEVETPAGGNEP